MSDLTKRLYKIAKDKAFRHHHVNMYAPGDNTSHKDFIEWEAADEIERILKQNKRLRLLQEDTALRCLHQEDENKRLRGALERIANPITDDEVHWINTDEIVSIAREALNDEHS